MVTEEDIKLFLELLEEEGKLITSDITVAKAVEILKEIKGNYETKP